MPGIIYFVQPCELVGTNRYKIGCSGSPTLNRIKKGYRKGTRYINIMEVESPMEVEKTIKMEFCKLFTLIAGTEFFEGNELDMLRKFIEIGLQSKATKKPTTDTQTCMTTCIAGKKIEPTPSTYEQFIEYILNNDPSWFLPGKWLPKSILADNYNKLYNASIEISGLIKCLKSNKLFQKISIKEKRSRYNGSKHPISLFLARSKD